MDHESDNIDALIRDLGGCGRFQKIVSFFIFWVKVIAAMSLLLMAYGNHNPGWKCLDNSTSADLNISVVSLKTNPNETGDEEECAIFEACHDVEFKVGVSTIVTEWHLICDRAWIISLIISLQMAGGLVGAYMFGYFGDKFGRKSTMYAATIFHIVFNIVAIFSNSWQMLAALRFIIGLALPIMMYLPLVLALEFAPPKWRNFIVCCPLYPLGALLMTFSAWATEDWRYLHGIVALASFLSLLPCYWMPESLRWLVVKDRMKRAFGIVKTINNENRRDQKEPSCELLQRMSNNHRKKGKNNDQSCLLLLRKEVRRPTLIVGIACMVMSMVYYAISFGIGAVSGNLYVKLLLMFTVEMMMGFVSAIVPNYIGRKLSIVLFLLLSSIGLFGIVGLELAGEGDVKEIGVAVGLISSRALVDGAWDVITTLVGELYPTVIRSTSVAYSNWISRIGAIIAPYLIPSNPETYYINYSIMAVFIFICCALCLLLPETKGRPLKDTWEVEANKPKLEEQVECETLDGGHSKEENNV